MNVWIVIAVRSPETGKSRLASLFPPAERGALSVRMFGHVLQCAVEAFGGERILVVTRSRPIQSIAAAAGASVVRERGEGLNAAFAQGRRAARRRGAEAVLALSADLPLLSPDDISAMCAAAGQDSVVLASDRHGSGTNALLVPVSDTMPFLFGSDSRNAHVAAALAAGFNPVPFDRRGAAFDLDTPEDWQALSSDPAFVQHPLITGA